MVSDRRSLVLLFVFSLALRVLWTWWHGAEPTCIDSTEYYLNSKDLQLILAPHGETSVWQHNPGLIAWAHLVHGFYPVAQAIVGAATCVLMEVMYPGSGWLLAVWLPHVAATGLWLKWVIAGFAFALAWRTYLWRWWTALLAAPVLVFLFWSMVSSNISRDSVSPLWRIAGFWMPITELGGRSLPGLQIYGLAWLGILFLLIRLTRTWPTALLLAGLSVGAVFTFGVAQQRLPFEPVLLGLAFHECRRRWDEFGDRDP